MLFVQKYGGTSLADAGCIRKAARRIAGLAAQGHGIVVVVSAQGQLTDEMIRKAEEICGNPSAREMDAYLAAGEQMSAALMAMALETMGCPAVSLTGWQAGIRTEAHFGDAQILEIEERRLRGELAAGRVPVVAGFQGVEENGNITTLGRGGSDTTAVALSAALKADVCQIFTDVDGVYDRDPRRFPEAVKFERIGFGEMEKLIAQGAQVLHERSVETARRFRIPLEVRSAFREEPGTIVGLLE